MFFKILSFLLLGCLAGVFTGLIPGLHINLLSFLILSLFYSYLNINPFYLVVFILSMAITHTFLNSIPSIFLGAPSEDTALSVLPGHILLLKGQGYEAVKLTVIGSLLSLILFIFLSPLTIKLTPLAFSFLKPYIGYILLSISLLMILSEKTANKRFWAFFIFLTSGVFGMITFSLDIEQPLFPMLSGIFGSSLLILSILQKTKIPKQILTDTIKTSNKDKFKSVSAAVFSGSLTALFPGLSSSQAAILSLQLIRYINIYSFLILIGGINTSNFLFSLITLLTINKARNGAVVVISKLLPSLNLNHFLIFILVSLISGGIATILSLNISKVFSKFIEKINYNLLCLLILIFLVVVTFYFSSFLGLIIFFTGTAIGMIPPLFKIKRTHAMGCLLLPVTLFYLL